MKDAKQILVLVSVMCLLGLVVSFLVPAYDRALMYVVLFLFAVMLVAVVSKGRTGVYEWLIIYMMLIPLHDFRIGGESFFLRLTEIAFIPFFVAWLFQKRMIPSEERRSFPPEYIAAFFFLALSFLSIWNAVIPLVSLHRTLVLAYLIVFSVIVWDILAGDEQKIAYIIRMMFIIATVTGVISMFQALIPSLYPFYPRPYMRIAGIGIIRAGAWWYDPSYYGLYMSMIIPVTMSMLRSSRFFSNKSLLRSCLWVQWGGLLASGSRASLIGVFVAYLFLLWVRRRQKIALTVLFLMVLMIAVAVMGMPYLYNEYPALAAFLFHSPVGHLIIANPLLIMGFRLDAWRANIAMFLDNPLLGVGPFMAGYRYKDYYPRDHFFPLSDILHPHSEYFALLSERGFLGFIMFGAFLILLFNRARNVMHRPHGEFRGLVTRGVTAGLICFLIFSVTGTSIYTIQFWLMVGILIAASTIKDEAESNPALPNGGTV